MTREVSFALIVAFVWATTVGASDPPITAIAFAPDGNSVVACSQLGIQIFGWPDLRLQRRVPSSLPNLHDVAFSGAGDRLVVGGGLPADEGGVELFLWPECTSLKFLSTSADSAMSVAWHRGSKIVLGSLDHTLTVWDIVTERQLHSMQGHSRGVTSVCILPDGATLVSAGIDNSLRVWSFGSGTLVRSLSLHTLPINDLALRPGERSLPMVASASDDKSVRLWQPTIGRMVRFARLDSKPLDVEWIPDGSLLVAACTNGRVEIVDPETVRVTQKMHVLDGWAYSIAVHPTDGSVAVGGSGGKLHRVILPSR